MSPSSRVFTHPGRLGDCLWALPAMRQLGGGHLIIHRDLASLLWVLEAQEYVRSVAIEPMWEVEGSPLWPWAPSAEWVDDSVYHLGYREWPKQPLPFEVWYRAGESQMPLDTSPWIAVPSAAHRGKWLADPKDDSAAAWIRLHHGEPASLLRSQTKEVLVDWSDHYYELKLGILHELQRYLPKVRFRHVAAPGSRMAEAGALPVAVPALAYMLGNFDVVLTDCAMPHVLAAAVGVKTILVVEPDPARHHRVFWPGSVIGESGHWLQSPSQLGERIIPVLGNDHRPTFDARHTRDAVAEALDV